ncbi:hypothetical protein [Cobetia sp. 1AS1]|uniref:hypothetical protein n=1 Tax=Cobetia sp. 1AS1 TaxID=3040016 RepID=UPI002448DF10|nr:hypothetical protein [Cobetia sp. 1AS1]MDH2296016.1 hypothetical protein [Cobetia sp. 1AS1]
MFAPLNGAPLNGGATGLWAEGTASAEAQISVSADIYSIESVTMPSRQANSESSAVGLRITSAPTAISTASASAEGVGLRITSMPNTLSVISAGASMQATRYAPMEAAGISQADSEATNWRAAYLDGACHATASQTFESIVYSIKSITMPSRQASSESWADGLRITSAPVGYGASYAEATGVALRITPAPQALGESQADTTGIAIRQAGFDTELIIEAVTELTYERHAYLSGDMAAESEALGDNSRRTRAKARSAASAFTAMDGLRPIFADAVMQADADEQASFGIVTLAAGTSNAWVDATAHSTRFVGMGSQRLALASSMGTHTRLAYLDGTAASESDSSGGGLSSRQVQLVYMAGTCEARIVPDSVVAERTAWAKPTRARTQTISWLDESDVDVLRVRQRYAVGTAVARSSTRAVPNTILGYSQVYVQSESVTDPDKLWLVRGVEGQSTGEVDATTRTSRITVIEGNPIGEAFTHIAPTITRDGVAYSYATGQSEAEAEQWFNALNYTWAPAGLSPAQSDAILTPYMDRDGRGDLVATAGTTIVTRINPWVFAKGRATVTAQTEAEPIHYRSIYGESVMEPTAETQAEPIHYRSIYADAVLDATADSEAEPTHYRSIYAEADLVAIADPVVKANRLRWVGMDGSTTARSDQLAEAIRYRWVGMRAKGVAVSAPVAEAVRLRWVGMEALAISVSDQLAENGVTHRVSANDAYANVISIADNRRWTSGQGTSHSYARGGTTQVTIFHVWYAKSLMRPTADQRAVAFRITSAPPGQCTARASVGRGSFIINPGAAAPDRRTIVVPATDRSMTVAATNREYQVA